MSATETSSTIPPLPSAIRPHVLILELLGSCDMRCPMCVTFTHRRPSQRPIRREHIRERLFKPAVALGISRVALSGGEATLRNDLPDIMRDAVASGLKVTLCTNLWHTPSDMMREIISIMKGSGSVIRVSFDSIVPYEMQQIRGADAFDRVLENIRSLLALREEFQSNVKIEPVAVIQEVNLHSVIPTLDFLLDEMKPSRVFVGFRHEFSGVTLDNYHNQELPAYARPIENRRQLLTLFFKLHQWAQKESRLKLFGRFQDWTAFLRDPQCINRPCGAGRFLYVDAYGLLRPCQMGETYADLLANDMDVVLASSGHQAARKLLDVCRICLHGCNT